MIKNFNINKNSTQSGRSMIEMLGVLAIVGVLSVGGIAGYSKAMEKFKINKTVDHVSQIATNIRTLYAQQTTYQGLNTANAIKMGVTPEELGTGTTLTNAFGGSVWVGQSWAAYYGDYDKQFTIGMTRISKQACIEMATMDWGNAGSSGLVAMNIGWVTHSTMNDSTCNSTQDRWFTYCSHKGPLTVAQATQACNNGYEGSNDYGILWIFK